MLFDKQKSALQWVPERDCPEKFGIPVGLVQILKFRMAKLDSDLEMQISDKNEKDGKT